MKPPKQEVMSDRQPEGTDAAPLAVSRAFREKMVARLAEIREQIAAAPDSTRRNGARDKYRNLVDRGTLEQKRILARIVAIDHPEIPSPYEHAA